MDSATHSGSPEGLAPGSMRVNVGGAKGLPVAALLGDRQLVVLLVVDEA